MYREIICSVCVCVVLMQVALVTPAPVQEVHEGSKLTVHFNDLAAGAETEIGSRMKRHANNDVAALESGPSELMNQEEEDDSAYLSRQRRTAGFFLSAAIKLCDEHPHCCKSVEIRDENVHLTVRIADE